MFITIHIAQFTEIKCLIKILIFLVQYSLCTTVYLVQNFIYSFIYILSDIHLYIEWYSFIYWVIHPFIDVLNDWLILEIIFFFLWFLTVPVPCQSEQLPQSQYLVSVAPVPYLSRQLFQLDIFFTCFSSVSI